MGIRKIGDGEQIVLDQAQPQNTPVQNTPVPQSTLRKLAPDEEITLDADRAVMNPRHTTPVYYPKQETDTSLLGHLKAGATDATRRMYGLSANLIDMAADKVDEVDAAARMKYYDIFGYPEVDPNAPDTISAYEGANPISRGLRDLAAQDSQNERILAGRGDAMNVQDTVSYEDVKADPLSLKTGRFILEQGARSLPEMGVAMIPYVGLPTVMGTTTQNVLEERNVNQGEDANAIPSADDLQTALLYAAPSAALERAGALGDIGKGTLSTGTKVTKMSQVPGAVARSSAGEAGTEFIQENLELAGATEGTDVNPTLQDRIDTGIQGALIGGPMGGTIRGTTETINVATQEKPAPLMIEDGRTEQSLGTDAQQEPQGSVQVAVPPNRDDLADAINNDTPLAESRTIDLPQVDIDPALQQEGFVVGANIEQTTEDGEIINGVVSTAQMIDGELEVTVVDRNGEIRTLFASDGDISVVNQPDPVQQSPEPELPPAPPAPESVQPPVNQPPQRKGNDYENMGLEQLTSVLQNVKANAKAQGWNKMSTKIARQVKEQLDTRFPEWDVPAKVDVAEAAQDVNPEPTEAQKEAGNYKKGHVSIQGLPITLENTKGSPRRGTDQNGKSWEVDMPAHYGYIKRTSGADSEQVDVYVGETPSAPSVFIVDQVDADNKNFDEHKAFIGFENADQVKATYNAAFNDGRGIQRYGGMTEMTVPEFKDWLKNGDNRKPLKYQKPSPQEFVPQGPVVAKEMIGEREYNALDRDQQTDITMMSIRWRDTIKENGKADPIAARVGEAFSIAEAVKLQYGDAEMADALRKDALSIAKRYAKALYDNISKPVISTKIKTDERRLAKKIDEAHDFMDAQDAGSAGQVPDQTQDAVEADQQAQLNLTSQQESVENDSDNAPTEDNATQPQDQPQEDSGDAPAEPEPEPTPEAVQSDRPVENSTVGNDYFNPEKIRDAQNEGSKSREILIQMTPDDFLKLALPMSTTDISKTNRVAGMLDRRERFQDVPFISFQHDGNGNAKVVAHEGRHRAAGLKELGVTTIPVRLISSEGGGGEAIRWGEQPRKGAFDVIEGTWPQKLVSENGNRSIDFPIKDLRDQETGSPKPQVIEYNGTKISEVLVSQGEDVPPKTMWSVQTIENKQREANGKPASVLGNTLHDTLEEAKKQADFEIKKFASDQRREQLKAEEERKAQEEKAAIKADTLNGFLDGKPAMQQGKIRKNLSTQIRFSDAGILTKRQRIENLWESGNLETDTFQENKVKPMTSRQIMRSDNAQQAAHEKRVKEAGKKTTYLVNGSDLGKVAYDYANFLLENKVTQPDSSKTKSDKAVKEKQDQDEIVDFGEKLEGAKKDLWQTYNHTLTEALPDDLSEITMSKHFPEPNYKQLIEDGMDVERLATFKALRDEIGNKPRVPYKLKAWAGQVADMRELAHSILNDGKAFEKFKSEGEKIRGLGGFFDRIQLYKDLGYPAFTKAKDWKIRKSRGVYENGKPLEGTFWFVAKGSSWGTRYDSYEEGVKALKSALENDKSGGKRKTKLDIYRVTRTGEIIVGKKVASGKFIDLKGGFENGRQARAYLNENYDDLVALLEKKKNVPPVRRSTNDPRLGEDYRDGVDVSPDQFGETFGFRGVQFGNYVEQKKRQRDLNNAFDGLTDMARIIGVEEKALSLNGTLGLAFGARGSGGVGAAAAHYEPDNIVINLTKISGAGSLGHEWFHALDNYFGTLNDSKYLSENPVVRDALPVRKEVVDAYKNLMSVIRKDTKIVERSKELDKLRSKDYWSTGREMVARSFEAYLIRKAEAKGGRNDYLANIDSQGNFEAIMGDGTYPYPIESEIDAIVEAYDKLFDTIQTKQTDKGIAMFKRMQEPKKYENAVSREIQDAVNARLKALGWPQANFSIYNSPDQLQPLTGLDESVEGFYWRGMIHVAANATDILGTINHEIVHALKAFGAFTDAEWTSLEQKAQNWRKKYNIDETYRDVLLAQGVTNPALLERKLNEEAIAHAFQDFGNKGIVRRIANRAVKFIKAIGDVLSGKPYNFSDANAVFEAIESGKISQRLQAGQEQEVDFPMYKLSRRKGPALNQAKESLAQIRGLENNLGSDLKRLASWVLHPQQIATLYKEFTPVYRAVIERFKQREVLVHQLSKNVDLYNKLDEEAKTKVNAALEIGRLSGKTFKPQADGTITVTNESLKNTVHSSDGDTITLSQTEAAAYLGVRRTMDTALDKYMETILEEYGLLEQGVKTIQGVEKLRLKAAKDGMVNEVRRFKEILQRLNDVKDAKKKGYIPFKRWGEVGVSVKDADGEMVHFERIELPKGWRKKGRIGENKTVQDVLERLSEKYNTADYDINFFEMNRFDEVAANIDLRSLDILASSSEMSEKDYHALREMLEKEMQKRGFRSHFFRSKDVPGYSEDFERAINDYVVSISSYISRRMHEKNIEEAVSSIAESGKPALHEYAQEYQEYSNDPEEELATIRMMGFFWYLAGNVSSGLVNLTQPFLVTAPYFSAKFDHSQIGKQMSKAYVDAAKIVDFKESGMDTFNFDKAPADIRDALKKAYEEGDFLSMATHDAMAISNSSTIALRGLEKKKRWVQDAIALTFSIPERTNRVVTFIAAYRLALDPKAQEKIKGFVKNDNFARSILEGKTGKDFAFSYAELAVVSTQYRVGKLNRPKMSRGLLSLPTQFWSFMMQTFELMYKLSKVNGGRNKTAVAAMMLSIVAVAGLKGIPFEDDLQDLIEKLYKFRTGKDLDIDTKMREFIAEKTGSPFIAETLIKGAPASVLNLDMSGRLGFGNVAPDRGSDFLGVWWDMLYERPVRAAEYANKGDAVRAVAEVSPAFLRNPLTAYTWAEDGIRTQKGSKVLDSEDVINWDVGLKFFGFTTSKVSRKRDEVWAASRLNTAVDDLRGRYYSRIAKALAERNRLHKAGDAEGAEQMSEQIKAIMDEIRHHNATHDLHERIFPNEYTIKQRYMEEMSGADARKTRKQARPRREELKEIYGY